VERFAAFRSLATSAFCRMFIRLVTANVWVSEFDWDIEMLAKTNTKVRNPATFLNTVSTSVELA
jgi:hypothetical protein